MKKKTRTKWLLVLPVIGVLLFIIIFPLAQALYLSFMRETGGIVGGTEFAGFYNYLRAFGESRVWNSLLTTFKILGIALPIQLGAGMVLALALREVKGRLRRVLASYLLIPTMVCPAAISIVWFTLFSHRYGPINYFVQTIFKADLIPWFTNPRWALIAIVIADVWEWTPFIAIVFLAGLVSLSQDTLEAAKVDGANAWQRFFQVILPLTSPIIISVAIIRTIDLIRLFELSYILTQGGPGNTTEVVSLYIYRVGFKFWNMPYAASLSFLLLIIMVVLISQYIRFLREI